MIFNEQQIAIASAVRTPIGAFGGSLKNIEATILGSTVIQESIKKIDFQNDEVDEVIMGNVYQAGQGPNPARTAGLFAELPNHVPAMTVNKVCGSGLKSIALAAQSIICGDSNVVVAGGMENMSRAPFLSTHSRWGKSLGNVELVDSILRDGLWDYYCDCHMGSTAERLAEKYEISRIDQDKYAVRSQELYFKANDAGLFQEEIIPVKIPNKNRSQNLFETDEHPRKDVTVEKLSNLRPAFETGGTVTPGNASGINDGAAAIMVLSKEKLRKLNSKPLAYIRGFTSVGVDPKIMGIGPAFAVKKLLDQARLSLTDIDLLEINEAFAAQILAVGKELKWDLNHLNVNGGAIALGHPIGASGARIVVTLLHEMKRRQSRFGIASLCIGGGMGIAMLFERDDTCQS